MNLPHTSSLTASERLKFLSYLMAGSVHGATINHQNKLVATISQKPGWYVAE